MTATLTLGNTLTNRDVFTGAANRVKELGLDLIIDQAPSLSAVLLPEDTINNRVHERRIDAIHGLEAMTAQYEGNLGSAAKQACGNLTKLAEIFRSEPDPPPLIQSLFDSAKDILSRHVQQYQADGQTTERTAALTKIFTGFANRLEPQITKYADIAAEAAIPQMNWPVPTFK